MRSESLVVVHEEDDDNDEVLADKQDLIYKKIFHILRYDHKLQYITIVARMCNILQCS